MSCAASRRVVSVLLLAAVLACGTIDAAEQWSLSVDSTLPRGVSITGIAGPDGGDPDKPVGTVWIGACGPVQDAATCERHLFSGDRAQIRRSSVHAALDLLARVVGQSDD